MYKWEVWKLVKTGLMLFYYCFVMATTVQAESLPVTVKKIKPSIVGVGTFMPSRSPRGVFLGTGFVVGNGQLVVTNAHVVTKLLDYEIILLT